MSKFTHLDDEGKAHMVDISGKSESVRVAVASGAIMMAETTLDAIRTDSIAKGDVLSTARIAGIMAAKKTSELIPLCHPLSLDQVTVNFDMASEHIVVTATARITGKTGVEMEALTAATTALLTIYDMAKAVQKDMVISDIKLLSKTGGKSGDWSAK